MMCKKNSINRLWGYIISAISICIGTVALTRLSLQQLEEVSKFEKRLEESREYINEENIEVQD